LTKNEGGSVWSKGSSNRPEKMTQMGFISDPLSQLGSVGRNQSIHRFDPLPASRPSGGGCGDGGAIWTTARHRPARPSCRISNTERSSAHPLNPLPPAASAPAAKKKATVDRGIGRPVPSRYANPPSARSAQGMMPFLPALSSCGLVW
jgi:hypothetical protein